MGNTEAPLTRASFPDCCAGLHRGGRKARLLHRLNHRESAKGSPSPSLGSGGQQANLPPQGKAFLIPILPHASFCWPSSVTGSSSCTFLPLTGAVHPYGSSLVGPPLPFGGPHAVHLWKSENTAQVPSCELNRQNQNIRDGKR